VARLIQVELPPRAIVDALLGGVPLDGAPMAVGWDPHGGRELLDLREADGSTTRVWLDSRDRVWDPLRAEHRDARGALVWRIEHFDFGDHDGARLPARTTVEDPVHRATVHLRYREQSLNPSFPANGFRLPPPPGLPVQEVDCR
jgi:outer membrane lipoprotein-sorting protein